MRVLAQATVPAYPLLALGYRAQWAISAQIAVTPELHGLDVICSHCQRQMSIPGLLPEAKDSYGYEMSKSSETYAEWERRRSTSEQPPRPRDGNQKYCSNCGALIDRRAVICVTCGVPVTGSGVLPDGHIRIGQGNWKVIAGALIVIVGFFLPWADFGLFSTGGYEIPSKLSSLIHSTAKLADRKVPSDRVSVVTQRKNIPHATDTS